MLPIKYLARIAIGAASLGLVVSLLVAGPGVATPAAAPVRAAARPVPSAVAAPAAQDAANYVGQETCLGCHADQSYKGTAHAMTTNPRTPAATHGCESCHGPGKAHVDGDGDATKILNPGTMAPQKASEQCVSCHNRDKHALWPGSQHDQRNVGCVTCHSVHAPKGPTQLKAADEIAAVCHLPPERRQQTAQPVPSHAGPRRQDAVLVVPQPTRFGQPEAAGLRDHRRPGVCKLPRREARPVSLGARAGGECLRHLPRPARLEQRAHARRESPVPLPALSRDVAAPTDGVRRVRAEELAKTRTRSPAAAACSATSRFTARTRHPGKRSFGSRGDRQCPSDRQS